MNVLGWGNYPKKENRVIPWHETNDIHSVVENHRTLIARGNGRSYGDSSLSDNIIDIRRHNFFLSFDEQTGLLHVQSGALLSDILNAFVPRGWFLKVTPGTRLITVGGAIASDVHGKNHHVQGCFSECIEEFTLMLGDGTTVTCSRDNNPELFHATCGGMGLTGIILDAKIYLKQINSKFIDQITIKTSNLRETFDAFEQYSNYNYSVAWIDCLAKGKNTGRCLLTVGEFCNDGDLSYQPTSRFNVPFYFPSFTLNWLTIKMFNFLYYRKVIHKITRNKVELDSFFYPLDAINNWNRIYGKNGFTQYQFILPKNNSFEGMDIILKTIAKSGKGSFLAVLKLYGPANNNYLSFPMEGYSLALDFKVEPGLFELLDKLDEIVIRYGGRIYLAKDSRVNKAVFEQGYPLISRFRAIRKQYGLDQKFMSFQSQRVGL